MSGGDSAQGDGLPLPRRALFANATSHTSSSGPTGAVRAVFTTAVMAAKPGNLAPQPSTRERSLPVPRGQGIRCGWKEGKSLSRSASTVDAIPARSA